MEPPVGLKEIIGHSIETINFQQLSNALKGPDLGVYIIVVLL